jgi:proline iminopeptidase
MFADLNGTRLFFDIKGSGFAIDAGRLTAKPTIVVLHGGLGFDHAYLTPDLSRLSDVAQILFVDLRGQGRSDRVDLDTCSLEQMADDVVALCRNLGIETPVILGHSAGGFVALHLALRFPGFAGGFILCNSSPTTASLDDDDGSQAPSLASRASAESLAAAGRIFSGEITSETISLFFKDVAPYYAAPANMDRVPQLLDLCIPDIAMMRHFMHRIAPSYDLRSRLGEVAAPVLILSGQFDWVCPPRASRFMARALQQARLVEFEASGHFPFMEEPAKFDAVVRAFIAEMPPERG